MLDRELLNAHMQDAPYQLGEAEGKWTCVAENGSGPSWPSTLFAVKAKPIPGHSETYYIRMDLMKYPHLAPKGCFWDPILQAPLGRIVRPKVTGIFAAAFNPDWQGGKEIYAPWDRSGLTSHPEWRHQHPLLAWREGVHRIEFYLQKMWSILNSENYHGCIGS